MMTKQFGIFVSPVRKKFFRLHNMIAAVLYVYRL